jgi:hypothetical protein
MHNRFLPIACAVAVLAASGCDVKVSEKGVSLDISHGKATEEWNRSYPIAAGGHLEIVDVNGTIEVGQAPGGSVEVRATREARAGSDDEAQSMLRTQPKISEQASANEVRIAVEEQANAEGQFGGARTSVQFHVAIPAGLTATFRTRNGDVRLDNVNGRFDASTTNGRVVGFGVVGALNASTVNGELQIGIASLAGDVSLHGVNGGIRVLIAPTVDADIELTTVNGFVDIEAGLPLAVSDRSRVHLAARLNKGGPKISAQTTNGGVRAAARPSP